MVPSGLTVAVPWAGPAVTELVVRVWEASLAGPGVSLVSTATLVVRSEERRVGKESGSGGWSDGGKDTGTATGVVVPWRRRHTMAYGDWSSDVGSAELPL